MRRAAAVLVALAFETGCAGDVSAAVNCGRDHEIFGLAVTERDVQAETDASSTAWTSR